ncbi:maleylacetoacetate isomerase [Caballeronia sp. J97]|uniref:maleylacetoacetate isomerase n=1 Tax=Caballeronia sp. J97 TaxID=2805429 RepID=UPI002AB07160|nr:maleylacetoacetate isomerase [Caballeronia sp. J97]
MRLINYFRSSSSYRVRIACNLKRLPYDYVPVHLNRNGGEQFSASFSSLNPQQLVPVLQDGALCVSQSFAILEYLEERYPDPPLLPAEEIGRAQVRQFGQYIACEIHPINNLRVLKYLTETLGVSGETREAWARHWIETGLSALEVQLEKATDGTPFCFGSEPTLADCYLIPQLFNARRFGVDVARYPTLHRIEGHCNEIDAFRRAHPALQPDAE